MTSKARVTEYVVLREQTEGERYAMVGETEAVSSTTALRQVISRLSDPDGAYVAIPKRSFQVVTVAVKQVAPQLIIGGQNTNGESAEAEEEAPKPQSVPTPAPVSRTPVTPTA